MMDPRKEYGKTRHGETGTSSLNDQGLIQSGVLSDMIQVGQQDVQSGASADNDSETGAVPVSRLYKRTRAASRFDM